MRDYSGETRLLDLLRELEAELAEQRRLQAIKSACAEGRKLLDQGQPKKAVQFVRQVLVRYPGDASLVEVLDSAENVIRERERARALDAIGRRPPPT